MTVQYVEGHFVESYYPTIEQAFTKDMIVNGQEYHTEIVDTAGQVSFLPMCPSASPPARPQSAHRPTKYAQSRAATDLVPLRTHRTSTRPLASVFSRASMDTCSFTPSALSKALT